MRGVTHSHSRRTLNTALQRYPGTKDKYTLCCGVTIAASDQPRLNKGWANATWERKQQITADHTYFELGMMYFLANDPKVCGRFGSEF